MKIVHFFNSLLFNNNHLYKKVLSTKLILFRKIYNFTIKVFTYKYRFDKILNLSLKEFFGVLPSFIEPNLPVDGISYIDGYSVPISCSCSGVTVTGCNIRMLSPSHLNPLSVSIL